MLSLQADRQEALVKAEQRRMALERANKMLFDETDDIKALHSKLQLSEVSQGSWQKSAGCSGLSPSGYRDLVLALFFELQVQYTALQQQKLRSNGCR